jgi:endonuclease/exonuclease/phosphatase family metal-dependent hydrolase
MKFLNYPIVLLWFMLSASISLADTGSMLTVCTWNIEHLAAQNETGCRPRKDADYRALKHFAASLQADIIAFQEVENQAAALRVFDPTVYSVEISQRPDVDLGHCAESGRPRRMQRVGFAIRKDLESKLGASYQRLPDVRTLACEPSQRWGVHIRLQSTAAPERRLDLLCVHLKSGCWYQAVAYRGNASPCSRLAAQVPRLEAWMDARASAHAEFVVLGDLNRQLDGLGDPVWEALDDSEVCTWQRPASGLWHCRKGSARFSRIADLERARSGRKHPYPRNKRYPFSVDHIIMSAGADQMAIEKSAQFIGDRQKLSDHTPLVMKLEWR